MAEDMIFNCIEGLLIIFLGCIAIYYANKCERLSKQLAAIRILLLMRCKKEEDWPDDEDTKKILGVLGENCKCMSYHRRTGKHAEGCPKRKLRELEKNKCPIVHLRLPDSQDCPICSVRINNHNICPA